MTPTNIPANPTRTHLSWKDEHGEIVVTPQNEDRFIIRTRKAAQMLQQAEKYEMFDRQFRLLVKVIVEWLSENSSNIQGSYITLRDGRLAFVAVKSTSEYDEEFEDKLSDLDVAIANDSDLDLIQLDAIGLPYISENALNSFLHPDFQLTFEHAESE